MKKLLIAITKHFVSSIGPESLVYFHFIIRNFVPQRAEILFSGTNLPYVGRYVPLHF